MRRDRRPDRNAYFPFPPERSAQAKRGFRWRRPRHTLKGRQDAGEIDRVGLRLRIRRQQAQAGDIVLLYGDESEALTHPYLAHAWAPRGADLRVAAPGQSQRWRYWACSTPSRGNSLCIRQPQNEVPTSSPCWRNSMPVSDQGQDERRNRWFWSWTTARSIPRRPAWQR